MLVVTTIVKFNLQDCFSDAGWLHEILLVDMNTFVIYASTYGPIIVEIYFTWLLLRYLLMFIEGFTPLRSKEVYYSEMVRGWIRVIVRNHQGRVSPLFNKN